MDRQTLQNLSRLGTKASLALAVAGALAMPLGAQAGSFQLPTDNAAGWARANAGGSLFANDPTAVYNNPAAMAFFNGPVIQVTGTGIRPSAKFEGEFKDMQGNPTTGNNPNGFGKFIPFPNMAFAAPVSDNVTLGGSITVPYGLVSEYNPTWQGRYFGTKTSLQSIAVSFSAGFKINDEFSIGVGVLGQRTKAQLNSMIDAAGAASKLSGFPFVPQSADVQLNVNVKKKFAFGYFAGMEWKPTAQDSIGFSYHSKVKQTLTGTYNLYGSATGISLLGLAPLFGGPTLDPAGGSASAKLDTPAFASLDWLHVVNDRFSIAATAKWTNWSSFENLELKSGGESIVNLPQAYKDSWLYAIGGDYKVNDQWTLRAGVGYDQTPSNIISRDPRIPDGARRLLGLGVGYQASKNFAFDLGYQHQFVGKTRVHLTNPDLLGAGTMDGTFDDHGDVVSLTGTYRF
ncbi:outer membrane protein transport protein [Rhodanobacter sp. FDAARGOS 1247]|uniref:outer membrane protein transport protein n=1 Tax=Rhodanobacter sp. FDAARGOS 1247 TaxID=2778082 RepID=UPI0019511554|nr:outer membrane protein transport protein [Rhodanobacter sp. FDAARGOS 1247]QRP65296.1 outer membrane protein transport protein [Rhodanobacter sp. FDAARGOS 1247]